MERRTIGKWRRWTAFLLAAVLFCALTWKWAHYLQPIRTSYGSMWDSFLLEPEDSLDVVVMGSSIAYCDVIPAVVWEESGLKSYVMAGPEQTMPLTEAYLREICRTQKPKVIVLEMSGMFFHRYQNYTKANLSTMPFSVNRFAAAFMGGEAEERLGICFPLYNYHYRWTEIQKWEFQSFREMKPDPLAGYTLLTDCLQQVYRENSERIPDPENYAACLKNLLRMKRFCEKRGVLLAPCLFPAAARIPDAMRETLRHDLAAADLPFYDLSFPAEEIAVDMDTDWLDGLHFNVYGAEKFSRWLGGFFRDTLDLKTEHPDTPLWEDRLHYFRGLKNPE